MGTVRALLYKGRLLFFSFLKSLQIIVVGDMCMLTAGISARAVSRICNNCKCQLGTLSKRCPAR